MSMDTRGGSLSLLCWLGEVSSEVHELIFDAKLRRKLLVSVHLDWWLGDLSSVDLNGDEEHAGAVAVCAST